MRAVPHLCEFYPGICLKTEEKAQKNLSQGRKNLSEGKKNLSRGRINLSQVEKTSEKINKNLSQGRKNLCHICVPTYLQYSVMAYRTADQTWSKGLDAGTYCK
jgi:hypothetical protein